MGCRRAECNPRGHWDPDSDIEGQKLLVRHLTDDEKAFFSIPSAPSGTKTVYRMRLKKDDFLDNGFTEGCLGCKAILSGTGVRGHTEQCRKRMNDIIQKTSEGKERVKRQIDRENEYFSRQLEAHDNEEARKKQKREDDAGPEGGARSGGFPTRGGQQQQ